MEVPLDQSAKAKESGEATTKTNPDSDKDGFFTVELQDDTDAYRTRRKSQATVGVARLQRNTFAAKKTVAQGMMDVALITANANQLRYLIEYQRNSPTFYLILFLIVVSLILQVAVGVSLIFKGRYDMRGQSKSPTARKINDYVVIGVFLITIVNVFVTAFSVSTSSTVPLPSSASAPAAAAPVGPSPRSAAGGPPSVGTPASAALVSVPPTKVITPIRTTTTRP